ncbi:DUF4328 domain-containing protein [Microbispora sp. H11081]|uniref:DUF4328 domain-containing protein n=1 Tax=Microbispora sp. H11081 TaxID=2729107 RepID=UPI001473F4DF|nr:DUF4328 domain-containing protein [Microbispora sp. H11081]
MYPTPPPAPLQPIRGVGTAAVVMLAADSVVCLMASVIDAQRAVLVDRFLTDTNSVPISDLETNDVLYAASGLVETVVYVATAVAFLVWLFRARANAEVLCPWPQRRATPWLIFGWVVPIVNFWFPKQIVDDIWTSSKPGAVEESGSLATARRSGLVWAWWLAWVVMTLVTRLVSRMYVDAEELPEIRDAAVFDIVGNVLTIGTAALAVAVVLAITRFQEDRRQAAFWSYAA